MPSDLGPVLKAAYPKVVATLSRVLGDMDLAMDATQDALVKALQTWPASGVPHEPVAWLITVGRNRGIDQQRRANKVVGLHEELYMEPDTPLDELSVSQTSDDMLRLMLTCCHPLLSPTLQITLVLKVILGFSTPEIARALLTSHASINKRITRAKASIASAQVEFEGPRASDIPDRIDAVLKAIYLLFNEGYTRLQNGVDDAGLVHTPLIDEAVRLTRMMCRLVRRNPQPRALLALMLLNKARLPARRNARGWLVPLSEQDRSLWNARLTKEGLALIDAIHVARHPPSAYQIQAAIAALHNQAASAEQTDWQQIVGLYRKLKQYDSSPVIPVNEAVALVMSARVVEAQSLLDQCRQSPELKNYQPLYTALAFASTRAGELQLAYAHYSAAIDMAESPAQVAYLEFQRERLGVHPEV
ncbi:MAG: DUF6596 domain-containing protein [Pseudomonadota bacterium]